MKYIAKLYYFLGSVYFAIILIAATALFVIAGTFLESLTDSHRFAASFTYSNPLFKILLWGFFINILLSALRRWPFKWHHIPFLTTHWGMLMILAGVLIKSYFGTQGSLSIMEGSASQHLYIPDSYLLHIEPKPQNSHAASSIDIRLPSPGMGPLKVDAGVPGLKIEVLKYAPHSLEKLETWVKNNKVYIAGLNPFDVYTWHEEPRHLPPSSKVKIGPAPESVLDLYAVKTKNAASAASKVYSQSANLIVRDTASNETIFQANLEQILKNEIPLPNMISRLHLAYGWTEIEGFQDPHLSAEGVYRGQKYLLKIPLAGQDALLNFNVLRPGQGKPPVAIDISLPPSLSFIEDEDGNIFIFSFDTAGRVASLTFRHDNLQTFIEYDHGFGGYNVQAQIPPLTTVSTRADIENDRINRALQQLQQHLWADEELSPPLRMIKSASQKTGQDFAGATFLFLREWSSRQGWLFPEDVPHSPQLSELMGQLNWTKVSPSIRKGCVWCALLFEKLDPLLDEGQKPLSALQKLNWPLLQQLQNTSGLLKPENPSQMSEILTALTHQIFSAAEQLPEIPEMAQNNISEARLLSAYFRAYGLHLDQILPEMARNGPLDHAKPSRQIAIECPVTVKHKILPSLYKLEDNLPLLALQVSEGEQQQENVILSYDRFGAGFKWPMLQGRYTIRFQPGFEEIPYKVRIRQARQINYAGSQQPFSYECDLIVADERDGHTVEKTISMNNVHETWDGYRFYLANIAPPGDDQVKRVQIVVNHDPAKYRLTYPGAFIMTLGIILLFWMDPYKKRKRS